MKTLALSILSTLAFTSNAYANQPNQPTNANILSITVYSQQLPRKLYQDVPPELCLVENAWVNEYYDSEGKLLERRYMGCDYPGQPAQADTRSKKS